MKRRLGIALLAACLLSPVAADPDPAAKRLPASTQVFINGHLLPPADQAIEFLNRLSTNPAVEFVLDALPGDWDPTHLSSILAWTEGEITVAFVRTGERSSLDPWQRRDRLKTEFLALEKQVGYLGRELERFQERFKRPPTSFGEMVAKKIRKTLPVTEHGEFVLVASPPSVTVRYKEGSRLSEIAEPPVWVAQKGMASNRYKPLPPTNLLLAVRSSNDAKAREELERLLGKPELADHWKFELDEELSPLHLQLSNGWLVGSDNPELLQGYLAGPPSAGLDTNPRYQFQRAQLPASSGNVTFAFVDAEDFLATTNLTSEKNIPPSAAAVRSFGMVYIDEPSGISLLPRGGSAEAMVQVVAPANSTWTAGNSTDLSFLNEISADSQVVYAVHLPTAARVLETVTNWDPVTKDLVASLWEKFQGDTGTTAQLSDISRSTGWLVTETDVLDDFVSEFRDLMGSSESQEGEPSLAQWLSKRSGSYSLQIFDPALQESLASSLWKGTGESPEPRSVGQGRYWLKNDHSWLLVSLPQKLLATSKISRRLALRTLTTMANPGTGLTRNSSLQEFRKHVRGEVVAFSSQKIDWLYSLIKGVLLLVDGQSRPEAEVMGRYRDSYAAVTIEPQGLRVYSAFYSEMPNVAVSVPPAAPNKDLLSLHDQLETAFHQAKVADSGSSLFEQSRQQGQLTACKSNLKNIATALEMWASDHRGNYPKSLRLLTPDYLRSIPTCPSAGTDTYSEHYKMGVRPDRFTIYCWGHHHAQTGVNRPAYTAEQGLIEK